MKKIPLTQGKDALVDDRDYKRLLRHSWQFDPGNGNPRAKRTVWYIDEDGEKRSRSLTMHREILKAKPGQIVDHINGNALDNRRKNLRFVTWRQNRLNARAWGKSGLRGVELRKGRWTVFVCPAGKSIRLGSYPTKEAAGKAYDDFAKKNYGKYARPNFK